MNSSLETKMRKASALPALSVGSTKPDYSEPVRMKALDAGLGANTPLIAWRQ